ncbi:DUF1648 domain-containing protein [Saccharopolyspora dendranthemae]|uniref:Uncharacterized protein DUF1648 n=1 Tax=Saccharopolyspora dendranthemae TaxID=1181886 RepID=A0A561VBK4_9PSEU|nr:DUF1648 domain-containing protein [Saccharopolyspora dendranthemae]TWG08998.1 uncharacterized protein DUF1648 [Saccharopolyspora dendranthemae]
MNHRKIFLAVSLVWTAIVALVLIGLLGVWRDRLPDPIATHWGFNGVADGSSAASVFPLIMLPGWLVLAGLAVAAGTLGKRRAHRAGSAAGLAAMAFFLAGITASTLLANLDHTTWQDVRLPGWHVPAVLVAAVVAGGLGWLLGNRGPDEPGAEHDAAGELALEPGQRAVWISSVTSPVLAVVGVVSLAVGLGTLALELWPVALPALLVGIVVSALSTVRIRVDERGVSAAFGPQRFPVRRIGLKQISSAGVARHRALEVGGWGYRVRPATTAIMLRSGECLVLRLTSGRDFVISVDKPERGAELINGLLSERSAM